MTNKKHKKKEEIDLENIPFVGGLFKGIEKLVDLAERVEEAGGEIKRRGKIKGLGSKDAKGVYGFSIRTGIGGQPRVQTFGNIRSTKKKAGTGKRKVEVTKTREPLADVFDEKDHVLIIVELPGIDEKSISLDMKENMLILEAGSAERKYEKEIILDAQVDFEAREVSFNNGMLKLKLKKKK